MPWPNSSALFLVIVLAFLNQFAGQPAQAGKYKLNRKELAPAADKLLNKDGELVQRDRVAESFRELQEVYDSFEDAETMRHKAKINKLVGVQKKDSRDCSRAHLWEINELVEERFPHREEIMPYLGQFFSEYVSFCERNMLSTSVAAVKREYRASIKDLIRLLASSQLDGAGHRTGGITSLENLIKGVLIFMEHEHHHHLDTNNVHKFRELFETHVLDMCRAWIKATDQARGLNEFFIEVQFDEKEREWLKYGTLCHAIESGQDTMVPILYHQLKKSSPGHGRMPHLGEMFHRMKDAFRKVLRV